MVKDKLMQDLKHLIKGECDEEDELGWDDLGDQEPLFGPDSRIGLDSLDVLQVSVAITHAYGVRIGGNRKETTEAMASIEVLADYILENTDA